MITCQANITNTIPAPLAVERAHPHELNCHSTVTFDFLEEAGSLRADHVQRDKVVFSVIQLMMSKNYLQAISQKVAISPLPCEELETNFHKIRLAEHLQFGAKVWN